jgi:PKD repeat protein
MKKFVLTIYVFFLIVIVYAGGWRPGEQQVKLKIEDQNQVLVLKELKIDFEPCAIDFVRAYLIAKERTQLESLGFIIETEIADLNKHFENFWITEDSYHSYQQIIDLADSLEEHFSGICKKYIFGSSLGGRQLAALKISDNVMIDEPEAEVFFDGGIHGDEIGGSENIIRFARDLCLNYNEDPDITYLVDNRETWLYLMVNPDGRVNMVRYNNNGVDLNRDCGYMWNAEGGSLGPFNEVESKALRLCNLDNQFVVYTSYHSGTEFVSYPWSYRPDATSDQAHINQLALVYVNESGYSDLPYGQGYSGMYAINGSTKDSYYGITGSVSWSIEISLNKQPPASQIMMYYNYNKPSMLALIEYAGYGLQGTITDASTGEPVAAMIFVNNYYPCYSDPEIGDYHKYVLPGTYTITVKANGYQAQTISNVTVTANNATTTDFQLVPEDGQFVYKFIASSIPGNNFADEGNTPAVLSSPDEINYSLGKSGYCMIDMQYPVPDGPGPDLIVYEGDATAEGYTFYVGSTIDGPWISLGTGSGTTEFDIAGSGLSDAQYIKLLDDGDGTANAANAGFDLDAIEALDPVSGVYLALYDYQVNDSNGNNNGKIDPGETVDILVTLKNNGDLAANNVQGEISIASSYLTIITGTANFGNLSPNQSGTGSFTVTANTSTPAGEPVNITLDVTSNNGSYTNSYTMSFIIGQIAVVIIDLDMNQSSGPAMQAAIQANDMTVEYTTDFPSDLNIYSCAFICLGIYSDNYQLSSMEGQTLATFLNNGGNLYMEGGDTWAYDPQTAVHSMFKIDGTTDGSSDMSTVTGKPGTFTEGMSFSYSGENNYMDHIEQIAPAFKIFDNQSPLYGTGVAYDAGTYKTIGCSHEFGGLTDGVSPSTKAELMEAYLEFFGISSSLQAAFFTNTTEICEEQIINFTDASTGNIVTWVWTFEGGSPETSSNQNPIVAYFNAGSFDVSLTVSDGTESSTIVLENYITVNTSPEIPEIPQGEQYPWSNPDLEYEYSIPMVVLAEGYEWVAEPIDAIESLVNNGTSCTIDFTDYWLGNVTLKVKAMNECGESEFSDELTLFVFWESVTENLQNEFRISPNPSDGLIEISFENSSTDQFDIRILNTLGTIIYQENVTLPGSSRSYQVDLRSAEAGIYIMNVRNNDQSEICKILIR